MRDKGYVKFWGANKVHYGKFGSDIRQSLVYVSMEPIAQSNLSAIAPFSFINPCICSVWSREELYPLLHLCKFPNPSGK